MSKITLAPNASGTGTLTVAAPNTNSDYTLTLPAETGTVLTSASDIAASQLPAGSVLQVVHGYYATEVSTTTNTLIDTGLTASITPSSASNKVLVIVHQTGLRKINADTKLRLLLLRGATTLVAFEEGAQNNDTSGTNGTMAASGCTWLDSPSSTSSVTYKTQFNDKNGTGTTFVQADNATSTIILMEIAA